MIAPSGYNPEEAEIRTIVNYDPDSGVITLNEGLEFDHLVHRFLEPLDLDTVSPEGLPDSNFWWGDGGQLAPEVGLLTHQIIIQGDLACIVRIVWFRYRGIIFLGFCCSKVIQVTVT